MVNIMVEVVATEFKNLRDLINASRSVSGTVVGYKYGEIRMIRDIAYIPISLGRGIWYILYTRDTDPIKPDTEAIEFTMDYKVKEVAVEKFGADPKSLYYIIIRPINDDIIKPLLDRIR